MFFCSLCCSKVPYALSNYDDSQTSVNFDNRLREMETKLSSIVDNINIKLDNHYKKIESKLTCQPDGNMDANPPPNTNTISSESVASLTTSFVAEQKEREKRELNLVLHNVPEPTAPDGSTRKQEDIAKISGIFDEYVDVKRTIKNAIRLGKKDTNKSRLLKITVGSTQEKITVLRNKLKLREESNPTYIKKIFIPPDYTPLEQKRTRLLENNSQK